MQIILHIFAKIIIFHKIFNNLFSIVNYFSYLCKPNVLFNSATVMRRYRFLFLLLIGSSLCAHAITPEALADSLNQWAELRSRWVSRIKVDKVETKGNTVSVYANKTLGGLSLSVQQLNDLRLHVALWTRRDSSATVYLYSENVEIGTLVSDYHKPNSRRFAYSDRQPRTRIEGLAPLPLPRSEQWTGGLYNRYIALWPSHGTYYNKKQQLWRWQRATMWTTVEDLYTTEYTRQIARMLENAGSVVLQPRPRMDGRDLIKQDGQWVFRETGEAYQTGRSGLRRWQEAACEWLRYAGYPDSIYDYFKGENDYKSDLYSRGKWVNFLVGGSEANPSGEGLGLPVDVCLAMHTDGLSEDDNRTTVGTLAIYYTKGDDKKTIFPNGVSRSINRDLADYVQTQIVNDIRALYCPEWTRRALNDANYAESRVPEIPTVLIELLSHKNMPDMIYGLDPQFRFDASRAVYKGLLRYMHAKDGTTPVVQPLPVLDCHIDPLGGDTLRLSWSPKPDPIEPTAVPTYYVVYLRGNDGEWQTVVCDTTRFMHVARRGTRYDYYVVAGNAGGFSFPSETLSTYLAPKKGKEEPPMLLILNAFNHVGAPLWFNDSTFAGIVPGSYAVEDGLYGAYIGDQFIYDRRLDWTDDDNCGFGMCNRDHQHLMTMGNTHDYPVRHGRILARLGYSYVSANATAIRAIDSRYAAVDIVFGKQPAKGKTGVIDTHLRRALENYLAQYGSVLLSGSYLGSGMPASSEKRWCEQQLHYRYRAPRACHNGQLEAEQDWLGVKQIELWQQPAEDHLFAESPESLDPVNAGTRLGCYADMRIPFGVAWKSYVSKKHPKQSRTIVYGFPLECSPQFEQLYRASIQYLINK